MKKPDEKTAAYYQGVLKSLDELQTLLKDNNEKLNELINTQRTDHQTNVDIQDNLKKIKFNTQ